MNELQRKISDNTDDTILLSVDYHGMDETSLRYDVPLTRNEMRALMIYFGKMSVASTRTKNCASIIVKLYHMFCQLNMAIEEEIERNPDDHIDPIPGGALR